MLPSAFQLVALKFIRSHVATGFVLPVGTGHTTLIRLQQMTLAVSTATQVACINCWAAREQRDGLCRATVVPQRAEPRVDVVHITGSVEAAGIIAAEVVTM